MEDELRRLEEEAAGDLYDIAEGESGGREAKLPGAGGAAGSGGSDAEQLAHGDLLSLESLFGVMDRRQRPSSMPAGKDSATSFFYIKQFGTKALKITLGTEGRYCIRGTVPVQNVK